MEWMGQQPLTSTPSDLEGLALVGHRGTGMHQRAARRARAAGPLGPGCPTSGRSCVAIPAPRPGQPQQGMALGRRPAPRSPGLSRPACKSGRRRACGLGGSGRRARPCLSRPALSFGDCGDPEARGIQGKGQLPGDGQQQAARREPSLGEAPWPSLGGCPGAPRPCGT